MRAEPRARLSAFPGEPIDDPSAWPCVAGVPADDTTRANAKLASGNLEIGSSTEVVMLVVRCEEEEACAVRSWQQMIRHVTNPDGTRRWATEPGPPPAGYDV